MDPIQTFINELASLVGVQGAFLFDRQGAINQYSTPMELTLDQGVALARTLSRSLTGLSSLEHSNRVDIELVFNEGRLVLKGLSDGGLCILCDRQVNYSLLNLTLEQGLGSLRTVEMKADTGETKQTLEDMKVIAQEILGEHAQRVINILDNAGTSREELIKAIEQAEKMTRMFIDKDQAGRMAQRMRELVDKSS